MDYAKASSHFPESICPHCGAAGECKTKELPVLLLLRRLFALIAVLTALVLLVSVLAEPLAQLIHTFKLPAGLSGLADYQSFCGALFCIALFGRLIIKPYRATCTSCGKMHLARYPSEARLTETLNRQRFCPVCGAHHLFPALTDPQLFRQKQRLATIAYGLRNFCFCLLLVAVLAVALAIINPEYRLWLAAGATASFILMLLCRWLSRRQRRRALALRAFYYHCTSCGWKGNELAPGLEEDLFVTTDEDEAPGSFHYPPFVAEALRDDSLRHREWPYRLPDPLETCPRCGTEQELRVTAPLLSPGMSSLAMVLILTVGALSLALLLPGLYQWLVRDAAFASVSPLLKSGGGLAGLTLVLALLRMRFKRPSVSCVHCHRSCKTWYWRERKGGTLAQLYSDYEKEMQAREREIPEAVRQRQWMTWGDVKAEEYAHINRWKDQMRRGGGVNGVTVPIDAA